MCLSLLIFKGFRVVDVTGLVWFVIQDDKVVCVANTGVARQVFLRRCASVSHKAKTAFKLKRVFDMKIIMSALSNGMVDGFVAHQSIRCYTKSAVVQSGIFFDTLKTDIEEISCHTKKADRDQQGGEIKVTDNSCNQ
jgi:hypothetical protein